MPSSVLPSILPEIHQIGKDTREILISREECPAFAEAGILLAGISDAKFGFSFVRHRPEFAQVMACLSGEGRVFSENRWAQCVPGEVYVTPAGKYHAYHAIRGKFWRIAWVTFLSATTTFTQPRLIKWEHDSLADTIKALHRECMSFRSPILMRQLVDLLLFHQHRMQDPSAGDERLMRLWSGVQGLLHENWNLARLAHQAHLSAEHLRRLCHQHYRTSPMTLLRDMRLRRAATLLQRTTLPIEEIADRIGYSDAFAFSKAFKRFFGINPSRQRQAAMSVKSTVSTESIG